VDPDSGGVYHVCSRCVRRAWLCGTDDITGRDFSHRREWIEKRILSLAEIFAMSVYGYVVMSNHYHIIIKLEPEFSRQWSDEEIADRWLQLCPGSKRHRSSKEQMALQKSILLLDGARLQVLRSRLNSLSWMMRFINEPLARLANREDQCTGRFWEGRFKSQRLLDDASVLACMVYVDLNPVRAGVSKDVTDSDFTSIKHRVRHQQETEIISELHKGSTPTPTEGLRLLDYINLLKWTVAEQSAFNQNMNIEEQEMLRKHQINRRAWFAEYMPKANCWQRAQGSMESLHRYAEDIGQHWIQTRSYTISTR